jgi:signal transduction histidine kinase
LSNAVKYSDGRGEVVVECEEAEDCCIISIKDQGIGIPKEEIQKLNDGFYRASNTNGVSGNGLGLFIVRQFLEHLNGKLELVSELNLGTCATIRLPKKYEEKSIVN